MSTFDLFEYSPIVDRPPVMWPGRSKLAFYVGLNIEHFHVDKPSTALNDATAQLVPDPLNYGWRDYGLRVGFWRVAELLDTYGLRATALLNSEAVHHYPQVIEASLSRDWALVAHGRTNSVLHTGMDVDSEQAELAAILDTMETATGARPRGWLGPALTETSATPRLLAHHGLTYSLDWTNDEQPYWFTDVPVMSVPYSVELNDLGIFTMKGLSGPDFEVMVRDQVDQMLEETATGRVMALALHPFVIGHPFRAKYLDRALAHIAGRSGIWLTTSDEIAAHFAATCPQDGTS
ncbi:polysaccharide deacetylase family protein [Jiangella endophytica]|uniref:polysaccharide deacetylase family protein n=1 Tax=Jiangella endophytica TaxID=1623398 RepID=UPI000E34B759|nr:polysaccharide deacetylase family protein [Jiangella endophytica]